MSDQVNAPFASQGTTAEIEHGTAFAPKFDSAGLLPAIVTDARSGDVLIPARCVLQLWLLVWGVKHFCLRAPNPSGKAKRVGPQGFSHGIGRVSTLFAHQP